MIKVAFNARTLNNSTLRGWNRYTINLLVGLSSLDVEIFLYSDQPLHKSHLEKLPKDSYNLRIVSGLRYVHWEQYWLPKQCEKDRVDILHCPLNFGLPWSSPCLRVLTLHDVIDQVYYQQDNPWYLRLSLPDLQSRIYHWIARNRADHIITVSQYSKEDIIKHLHIPQDKITVIYQAADPIFHQPISQLNRQEIRCKYQLSLPYIFYVGGWEKRKNIPFLVYAFAQAKLVGVDLVLAGGRDEQRDVLVQLGKYLGISEQLHLLGWVDDADLPALYAEAVCFVYPSQYEGFGLQLCEAMAVSCPILAARATCLPEILADCGMLFSLSDTTELANLLQQLSQDPSYYKHLAIKAKSRSQLFNWQITAEKTQDLYSQIMH